MPERADLIDESALFFKLAGMTAIEKGCVDRHNEAARQQKLLYIVCGA